MFKYHEVSRDPLFKVLVPICVVEVGLRSDRYFSLMKLPALGQRCLKSERFSNLEVITMYYSGRFEVDEICQAFQ